MDVFEVVVATGPSTAGDMLAHDLEVIRPVYLYADRVRLLSPAALFTMGTAAEFAVEDPHQRARVLVQMAAAMGRPLPPQTTEALTGLGALAAEASRGNRARRREFERRIGKEQLRAIRQAVKDIDGHWAAVQQQVYEQLVEGRPTEQLFHAAERGRLVLDPLSDGGEFNIDDVMDTWLERVREALGDPGTVVLFDDKVADLVRAMLLESGLDVHELARQNSRQVGLATNFLARLPTLKAATISEVLHFREEVEEPVQRYRAVTAEMAKAVDADLHDDDFGAWADERWRNEVAPALEHIEAEARRNGLLRDLAYAAGKHGKVLGGMAMVAMAAVNTFALPEFIAALPVAGEGAAVFAEVAKTRRNRADARRGSRFFLLHEVQGRL